MLKKYYPLEGSKCAKRFKFKTEKQCRIKAGKLGIKFSNRNSKYKFVFWGEKEKKWKVSFVLDKKKYYFGCYADEDEAGRVAMEKAKEYGKAI